MLVVAQSGVFDGCLHLKLSCGHSLLLLSHFLLELDLQLGDGATIVLVDHHGHVVGLGDLRLAVPRFRHVKAKLLLCAVWARRERCRHLVRVD